jgi:hypothetical protein
MEGLPDTETEAVVVVEGEEEGQMEGVGEVVPQKRLPVGDPLLLGVVLPVRDPLGVSLPPVGLKVDEGVWEVDCVDVVDTVTLRVWVTLAVTQPLLVALTVVEPESVSL